VRLFTLTALPCSYSCVNIHQVKREVGDVNILVNNAGIVTGKRFLQCPDGLIEKSMSVNVMAHFWVCTVNMAYFWAYTVYYRVDFWLCILYYILYYRVDF